MPMRTIVTLLTRMGCVCAHTSTKPSKAPLQGMLSTAAKKPVPSAPATPALSVCRFATPEGRVRGTTSSITKPKSVMTKKRAMVTGGYRKRLLRSSTAPVVACKMPARAANPTKKRMMPRQKATPWLMRLAEEAFECSNRRMITMGMIGRTQGIRLMEIPARMAKKRYMAIP